MMVDPRHYKKLTLQQRQYFDKAEAYHAKGTDKAKPSCVIYSDDKANWRHWMAYYAEAGMTGSVKMMRDKGTRAWGVPAKNPIEFDPEMALRAIAKDDERRAKIALQIANSPDQERRIAFARRAQEVFDTEEHKRRKLEEAAA